MRLKQFCICLIFFCCSGCVTAKARLAESAEMMISLPQAREQVINYHESGQYAADVASLTESVGETSLKAIREKVKFPAVVMVVEDVLLSTYNARKKQIFSLNSAAMIDLENQVILSALSPIKPSLHLLDILLQRKIPVFLVSYRPESLRVPVIDNLSKAGISGWSKLFMKPPNYPENKNFCEEVRKGLQVTGYNIIATVGVLPEDVSGEFAGKTVLLPNYIYSER
ncbi:HAD family acid phosphatase [Maridesulfovibrio sp.]|uniref:HAD family acid phosphatase n=1 Tax=Maridesulfovibrio sp. TaxID=2795000 RepID=UPI0029F518E3|nr:HAD family acid phosphatase [Maridesulfovibrio sp.]